MKVSPGNRDITVYVGFRPFEGEWIEKNTAVLNGLKWQGVEGLKIKFVCWPSEVSTASYASRHGYETVVVPWVRHYLFSGPQRSFKAMFETCLMDCDTEIFVYINGDIVLGPGILEWIQNNVDHSTLFSLPRHNWEFSRQLESAKDFETAFSESVPEEWTALDIFAMRATEARKNFIPFPPFLLTAGSMDSFILVNAAHMGWKRVLIPPDIYHMLHIEHEFSHPLKPGASPDKYAKWAFNCGVYEMATQKIAPEHLQNATLSSFSGAERYKFKYQLPTRDYQTPDECLNSDGQTEKPENGKSDE
ncbi:hypothetical protein [Maridesulfovibrio bastinii]|uniref:hypothetical protein n=1 Tax=Maridesulfovibrio bastinii TaxID=47157 RepID=UPI000416ECBB|nr:hypothetical protein [Maridesulfovibrio bastinii]